LSDDDTCTGKEQIGRRSCKGNKQLISTYIFVVGRIDNHWSSSSEIDDKNHQKSYEIYMDEWIWRKSSLELWCGITEFVTCPRMSILMEADRNDKYDSETDCGEHLKNGREIE
jgi:hypothetical protein